MAETSQHIPLGPLPGTDAVAVTPQTPVATQPAPSLRPTIDIAKNDLGPYGAELVPQSRLYNQEETIKMHGDDIKASLDKGNGFWPTALAVGAALSGNFGPAIALAEQTRKTTLTKATLPHIQQAAIMAVKGDLDGAQTLNDQIIASVSSRAPELAAQVTAVNNRIVEEQKAWQQNKNLWSILNNAAKSEEQRTGEKSIHRPAIDALKSAIDSKTHLAKETLALAFPQLFGTQVLQSADTTKRVQPFAGTSSSTPFTQVIRPEQIQGYTAQTIIETYSKAGYDFTLSDIVNIGNGVDVEKIDPKTGAKVNVTTPAMTEEVKAFIAQLQPAQKQLDLRGKLPFDSAIVTNQLRTQTPEQVLGVGRSGTTGLPAPVAGGTITPADIEAVRQRTSDLDNTRLTFDIATGQVRPDIPYSEAIKDPGRYSSLDKATQIPRAQNLFNLVDRLDKLSSILAVLPKGSTRAHAESFIGNEFNRRFPGSAPITSMQTLQNILKADIEGYFNEKGTSSQTYADLTRPLVSTQVNSEAFAASIRQIYNVLQGDFDRLVYQGRGVAPGLPQQQVPVTPQTAPQTPSSSVPARDLIKPTPGKLIPGPRPTEQEFLNEGIPGLAPSRPRSPGRQQPQRPPVYPPAKDRMVP